MKRYPKSINCDKRGQLIIPKDIRIDVGVDDGTAFWLYVIEGEGIILRKIDPVPLSQQEIIVNELNQKSDKVGIKKNNITKSVEKYEKKTERNLEVI